jgi:dihydrolipoamide dehydrogenase
MASPSIDLEKMRGWKDKVIQKLTGGLGALTKKRKINFVQGPRQIPERLHAWRWRQSRRRQADASRLITASWPPAPAPPFPPNMKLASDRVMDSTGALALADIPARMLVVGGGYIGCELGSVYSALGTKVSVVEMTPTWSRARIAIWPAC